MSTIGNAFAMVVMLLFSRLVEENTSLCSQCLFRSPDHDTKDSKTLVAKKQEI